MRRQGAHPELLLQHALAVLQQLQFFRLESALWSSASASACSSFAF